MFVALQLVTCIAAQQGVQRTWWYAPRENRCLGEEPFSVS
jgi:hypothetical protein